MSTVRETVKAKSPYKRGADEGIFMGALFIVLFLAVTKSMDSMFATWIAWILALVGVPGLTFYLLRRSNERDNGLTLHSSLWVQGIVIFFCGSLILALFIYLYLRWMNPTFMVDHLIKMADAYASMNTPQGQQISDTIHAIINQDLVPSAISIGIETIWIGVFTGSLLSIVLAWIVKLKKFRY